MSDWLLVNNDELQHHGIGGMRWGVKNGPPYPLRSGDHNAREKLAAKIGPEAWKKRYEENLERKAEKAEAKAEKAEAKAVRKARIQDSKNRIKEAKLRKKNADETAKYIKEKNEGLREEPTETPAEKKARLMKGNDMQELMANRDMFTTQELTDALIRAQKLKEIKDFNDKQTLAKAQSYIDKYKTVANMVGDTYESTRKLAKVAGAVGNVAGKGDNKVVKGLNTVGNMPSINGGKNNKKAKGKDNQPKAQGAVFNKKENNGNEIVNKAIEKASVTLVKNIEEKKKK